MNEIRRKISSKWRVICQDLLLKDPGWEETHFHSSFKDGKLPSKKGILHCEYLGWEVEDGERDMSFPMTFSDFYFLKIIINKII